MLVSFTVRRADSIKRLATGFTLMHSQYSWVMCASRRFVLFNLSGNLLRWCIGDYGGRPRSPYSADSGGIPKTTNWLGAATEQSGSALTNMPNEAKVVVVWSSLPSRCKTNSPAFSSLPSGDINQRTYVLRAASKDGAGGRSSTRA